MKQIAFVVEFVTDGEKTFYVMRFTSGQALACADSISALHEKIDSLFEEFDKSPVKE